MNIVLDAVTKIYGKASDPSSVVALDRVDAAFPQGTFCAITGPSGCGKTTLMRVIGCQDTPTHGSLRLDGAAAESYSDVQLAQVRNEVIGFIPQDFGLIHSLTVLENLCIPVLFSKKVRYREGKARAKAALASVGLDHLGARLASRLSGGQRQRVAVARSMIMNPDIILADEPTGSLHSALAQEMLALFADLHRRGKTVIVVTHSAHIAELCHQQYEMRDGKFLSRDL